MQMSGLLARFNFIRFWSDFSCRAKYLLTAALFAGSFLPAVAQTGHLLNGVSTKPASIGVATGADGSVYFFSQSATNELHKATPSAGGYTESVVLTSTNNATGNIAIDSTGAIYFISNGNVIKETPGGGSYTESTISAAVLTTGLTVDTSGNLYGTTSTGITKLTKAGTTYTAAAVVTGLSSPSSVAVDSGGNLYVLANSQLLEEKLTGSSYTQSVLATGLLVPKDVIVDGQNNLYYTDLHHIFKAVPSGSGFLFRLYGYFDATNVSGDPTPSWLAVDPSGRDLYVEGSSAGLLVYPTSSVDPPNLQFGSVALGSHSTQTLTYTFGSAVTLGSYRVVTQAATGLDYTDAGGGTCAAGSSYAAGGSCTVAINFSPKSAGSRAGAVTFLDGSGATIANAPLSGTGTAPQVAFADATATAIVSNNHAFTGIAVDGNGSVYLTDDVNKQVLKETPSGAGGYTQSVIASGLVGPQAIAVDGAGNLYVLDSPDAGQALNFGEATMVQFAPQASGTYLKTTVGTGLDYTTGVAVDSSGNVYTTDRIGVVKFTLLPGNSFAQTHLVDNGSSGGIAVDSSGDIFVSLSENGVFELKPDLTANYTTVSIGTYTLTPNGSLAVDGAGNVYVAGIGAGDEQQVIRLRVNADGTSSETFTAGAGIIAVDGSGSVYAVGNNISANGTMHDGVYKLDQATAPTINLFSAAVGTSDDVSDPIYFANIGNAPLTYSVPSAGTNPVVTTNFLLDTTFSIGNDCPALTTSSAASMLAPGDQCRYFVDFAPTVAGMLTGTLTATDDNLNQAGATQVIHLFGNATGGGAASPALSPSSWDFGTNPVGSASSAKTFTLSNPTAASLNITGISFTGAGAAQFAQTNNCGASLAASGSCTISVIFTAAAATSYSASLSVADDASNSPQIAALTGAGAAAAAPQAVPNPTSLAFGSVTVGTKSAAKTITLANPGNAPLDLTSIAITGANATLFSESDNCSDGLNAGSSCTITVTYSPAAVENDNAAITITDNAGDSPQSVSLSGAGVSAPTPDFTIGASPASQSISSGSVATYQIALTPQNGSFSGAIALTATGLPPGASVSFSPASVTPNGAAATSVMTITTVAQTTTQARTTPLLPVVPTSFAAVLLMPIFRRRFRKQGWLLRARAVELGMALVVLTLAGASVIGCSGGFALPSAPSTTYTVAVTGTSGQIAHSTSVTLTVK